MSNTRTQCPVCGQDHIQKPFLEMNNVPVHCNVLWSSQTDAQQAPRGDIHLGYCPHCGHVFNMRFAPEKMEYTQDYENSLHFSPHFQEYATNLAQGLVDRYDLRNKDIVEIGAGKGDFLNMLWDLGQNRGVGFDPSYVPTGRERENDPVQFVLDFYSEQYTHYPADLICCRHVLEHIDDPNQFIQMVNSAVNGRSQTIVFFEVPNLLFTVQKLGIWDIIYEHCSYFSRNSLARVFRHNGFQVIHTDETFGTQFITIEAQLGDQSPPDETAELEALSTSIAEFGSKFAQKVTYWQNQLASIKTKQQKVVVWGSGSKGVTFMNLLQHEEAIDHVVDINPRKQGKYVAGTGQKIIAPEYLQTFRPDYVIIMNANYQTEIQEQLDALNVDAQLLVA